MNTTTNLPAPSLPSSLASLYSLLNIEQQKLFNKVFMLMWLSVVPSGKRYGIIYCYWALERVLCERGLERSEFALLTYLNQMTEGGKYYINSIKLRRSTAFNFDVSRQYVLLNRFKKAGYIIRYSRDPSLPYLQRSVSKQKIFIQFTGKGVELIKSIERDMFNIMLNKSLEDITTRNN